MRYRHEIKHELSLGEAALIRQRLSALLKEDEHGREYTVRSLYFDTPDDRALYDKLNGVSRREKFRLRLYNGDSGFIRLEKKIKVNGLCAKLSERVGSDEVAALLSGDVEWLAKDGRPLLAELYSKWQTALLRPKTIVDYRREAFVYPAGNVRVTLDSDIRSGLRSTLFLDGELPTVPMKAVTVLEVKWDDFLPELVREAVRLDTARPSAFSKYAACRIFDLQELRI